MRQWTRNALGVAAVAAALGGAGCEDLPKLPPIASFIYTPVSPIYGGSTEVVFNASQSSAAQGQLAAFLWNFGDGSAVERVPGPLTSHVFPIRGCEEFVYTVLLTAIDDSGLESSASQTVRVLAPASACEKS